MKQTLLALIIFLSSVALNAQQKHTVTILSGFTGPLFSPGDLTIAIGDTVEWINPNDAEAHNVNGTIATYSANPEGFGNSVGVDWTYEHIFTIEGSYNYRCDPHFANGMVGAVNVESGTVGIRRHAGANYFSIYPNPASDFVRIVSGTLVKSVEVYNVTGQRVESVVGNTTTIDFRGLDKGVYFVAVTSSNNQVQLEKVIVK